MKSNKIFTLIAALSVAAGVNAQDVADSASWDKDVRLIFGSKNSAEILGGVSTIDMKEIVDKNYTTGALDNIEAYVSGFNGNSIWGYGDVAYMSQYWNHPAYLVLVDGYPRASNNLRPEEIDQITILKGAQAVAIYGALASNGAILITTKRGQVHDMKVSVRANSGFDVAKSYPELLGAAEYMYYYNKALANDGQPEKYSNEQIYLTSTGDNPYMYPDVNFYSKDYIRNWKNSSNIDAEIEGGNDFATFYTNIFFNNNTDYYKFGNAADMGNNTLAIRGNVNIKFSDKISAEVDAYTNMYNVRSCNHLTNDENNPYGGWNYWDAAKSTNTRPNLYPIFVPVDMIDPDAAEALTAVNHSSFIIDGMFLGASNDNKEYRYNVFADAYALGQKKEKSRDFQFNTKLHFDLGNLLQGLKFHTQFGMQYATGYSTRLENKYATFTPQWGNFGSGDVVTGVIKSQTEDRVTGQQRLADSRNERTFAGLLYFDWNRSFGDHNVSALASANGAQIVMATTYHRRSQANLGFNATYNWKHRYFLDLTGSIAHSPRLAEGNRNHLTKSASLGWNVTNEDFFNCDFFNNIMVSASVTDMNDDIDIVQGKYDGFFLYEAVWNPGNWFDGSSCLVSPQGSNPALDFVHRKEMSANLKLTMLDNSLFVDASIYKAKKTGLVQVAPADMFPGYMSHGNGDDRTTYASYVNFGENEYKGYDFSINYRQKFGDVKMQFGVNANYWQTVTSKRDDSGVDESTPWRKESGRSYTAVMGYKCLGMFQSDEEIAGWADQSTLGGGQPKVGDLKYADLNGDNMINELDQTELGVGDGYWNSTWNKWISFGSPFTLGFNYSVSWKNWTLFLLGTGRFGATGVKNGDYYWVNGEEKYTAVVRDCWTEDNPNAKYPRLTTGTAANNYQTSDFWTFKANRFDIAKVQLTYDFPASAFESGMFKFLSGAQVYVSGANLLTIAKEREHFELSYGSAPQTRFYNLGFKVTF